MKRLRSQDDDVDPIKGIVSNAIVDAFAHDNECSSDLTKDSVNEESGRAHSPSAAVPGSPAARVSSYATGLDTSSTVAVSGSAKKRNVSASTSASLEKRCRSEDDQSGILEALLRAQFDSNKVLMNMRKTHMEALAEIDKQERRHDNEMTMLERRHDNEMMILAQKDEQEREIRRELREEQREIRRELREERRLEREHQLRLEARADAAVARAELVSLAATFSHGSR